MREIGSSPSGEHTTVATFPSFKEAEVVVDMLAENNFPVQFVSIVADGIQLVKQSSENWMWMKRLGFGIISGTITGAAAALVIYFIGVPAATLSILTTLTYGVVAGGVAGGFINPLLHWMSSDRENMSQHESFRAKYYDVRVHHQYTGRACDLLKERISIHVGHEKLLKKDQPKSDSPQILRHQTET